MCIIILLVPDMLLKCSGSFQSLTDGYRKLVLNRAQLLEIVMSMSSDVVCSVLETL